MADFKKPEAKPEEGSFFSHPDPFVEIVWIILFILIAIYLINGFISVLNNGKFFNFFGLGSNNLPKTILLSKAPTLLGGSVVTSRGTSVFQLPGVNKIATRPALAKATLIDGPVFKDGVKYWKVRFDDGLVGWVPEEDLDYITKDKRTKLSDMPTIIGGDVVTTSDGVVLFDGPAGNSIGTVDKGIRGKIIEGPMTVNGVKYWHIKFDDGQEGWVREEDLGYVENRTSDFVKKFKSIYGRLKYFLVLFSIIALGSILYLNKKLKDLRLAEAEKLYEAQEESKEVKNLQWARVMNNVESLNENDWRLAIIEADIMLSDLLEKMSLFGDSIGDKLKTIEKSDFTTIDNAWEAHKIRNQIAHEGANFVLNQHEAKRVVRLYEAVFREFQII